MKKQEEIKKTPAWFYLVLILIPLIFIVFLEIALRIFNYGDDYTQWVKLTESKYVLNPDYTKKFFFSTKNAPYSNGNVFDVEKKANAFRIFILGGSSAAGFPFTPNGDFGRYLQKRLELEFPDSKIEVVNIAVTAINSYTLRDMISGVINQHPDLIIIYAGHNEYYGALGAGSMESVGNSRGLVNLVIYLNDFKITQLVRNTISWFSGLFSSGTSASKGGTLMARMAKDQEITLGSEIYKNGLSQFEGNMRDILEQTKKAGVPVILSTLTSNLKDQPPFVSRKTDKYPPADEIYKKAEEYFNKGLNKEAESLYVFAKDLDALRFRASSDINNTLKTLGKEFNYPVADIFSGFNSISPGGITGNSLMTDHLHPVLKGYQYMGKMFYDEMVKDNLLPKSSRLNIPGNNADSIAVANFYFSDLDSTIARFRITILKNDWPFSEPKTAMEIAEAFNVSDAVDSIALKVVDNKVTWEEAHRMAAKRYLNKKEFDLFAKEMLIVMDQFPFIDAYYTSTSETLLENQQYDLVLQILYKKYRYSPDAFSTKWLGIIELSKNHREPAKKFLKESVEYDPTDPQVLFNLAGAYATTAQFEIGLETINKCLQADPQFPGAAELKRQLEVAVGVIRK